MDAPAGKQNRLPEFDYSTPSAYFVTVCTRNRRNFFWVNVGAINDRPENVPLSGIYKAFMFLSCFAKKGTKERNLRESAC